MIRRDGGRLLNRPALEVFTDDKKIGALAMSAPTFTGCEAARSLVSNLFGQPRIDTRRGVGFQRLPCSGGIHRFVQACYQHGLFLTTVFLRPDITTRFCNTPLALMLAMSCRSADIAGFTTRTFFGERTSLSNAMFVTVCDCIFDYLSLKVINHSLLSASAPALLTRWRSAGGGKLQSQTAGGGSPGLHKRSAEAWGYPLFGRRLYD